MELGKEIQMYCSFVLFLLFLFPSPEKLHAMGRAHLSGVKLKQGNRSSKQDSLIADVITVLSQSVLGPLQKIK